MPDGVGVDVSSDCGGQRHEDQTLPYLPDEARSIEAVTEILFHPGPLRT
jgi:hypothetical protein